MFIKQGAQYRVYLLGGVVLKVPHSLRRATAIFLTWAKEDHTDPETAKKNAQESVQNGQRATQKLRELCQRYPDVRAYLCSPTFITRGTYIQKRVKLLDDVFKAADHDAGLKILEAYAQTLLMEWQYGFCETEFNLVINNGLDANGNVLLADFGDVEFSKEALLKAAQKKPWLSAWSYKSGLPDDLRQPFADIMARTVTTQNIERNWGVLRRDQQ